MKRIALLLSFFYVLTTPLSAQLTFERQILDSNLEGAISVFISDMDNDNQNDIVGLSHFGFPQRWYKNLGQENFQSNEIPFGASGTEEDGMFVVDMDSDGDNDILFAQRNADNIAWLENNGTGEFSYHLIDTTTNGPWAIFAADIDGDNDIDILCAGHFSAEIILLENNGQQFFTKHTIIQDFKYATTVFATDIDGDNDMDILGGANSDGIMWWENINNNFTTPHSINDTLNTESVYAFDADNDNDTDLIASSSSRRKIFLYRNDGNQNFSPELIEEDYPGAESLFTIDLDIDGDEDILCLAQSDNHLDWWENDGTGNFTIRNISTDYEGASKIHAADINGDGKIDLATASLGLNDISIWINTTEPVSTSNITSKSTLSIYPNPAKDVVYFDLENNQSKEIQIVNQLGKNVLSTSTNKQSIDISILDTGVYFIQVETAEAIFIEKIIKL